MTAKNDASGLPADRLWQPVTAKWFAALFGGSLLYAVLRYPIAGDVTWDHVPLYILNKATSLAAVFFVAASYLIGRVIRWHNHDARKLVIIKFCGLMGFSLAAMHAFFSLALLSPAYFGKIFAANGCLNGTGELALAFGVVGLWALTMPALATVPMMPKAIGGARWKRGQRMGYLALALVLAHLVVLGWKGWLTPSTWPAGMPPISLWAALAAALPLGVKLGSRNPKRAPAPRR